MPKSRLRYDPDPSFVTRGDFPQLDLALARRRLHLFEKRVWLQLQESGT